MRKRLLVAAAASALLMGLLSGPAASGWGHREGKPESEHHKAKPEHKTTEIEVPAPSTTTVTVPAPISPAPVTNTNTNTNTVNSTNTNTVTVKVIAICGSKHRRHHARPKASIPPFTPQIGPRREAGRG